MLEQDRAHAAGWWRDLGIYIDSPVNEEGVDFSSPSSLSLSIERSMPMSSFVRSVFSLPNLIKVPKL